MTIHKEGFVIILTTVAILVVLNAAAHFSDWGGWPSGMHQFGGGKALMKDVGVLLLVVMQRLFNDKKGFYPLFIVSNFGVWMNPLYTKTLWMCYIDAIPFFRATLTSNILFSAILFGGYYLLQKDFRSLQLRHVQYSKF